MVPYCVFHARYCDEGLVESVSTIIWASPRLSTDCVELKGVSKSHTHIKNIKLVFFHLEQIRQESRFSH